MLVAACSTSSDGKKSDEGRGPGDPSGSDGATTGTGEARTFPLVTPPVKSAAPQAFGGTGAPSNREMGFDAGPSAGGLNATDIKSRFFSNGPTNVYFILQSIDDRIVGLQGRAASNRPACLEQAPVAYDIKPFGQTIPFYAQCYESVGSASADDPGLVQFGEKDGVYYYYSAVGQAWVAAVLTPADRVVRAEQPADAGTDAGAEDGSAADAGEGSADAAAASDASADAGAVPSTGTYVVHAWAGVGYLNANGCGGNHSYDGCSYGVIELRADPRVRGFEMAVAGIGFGYCGAQLKSDGRRVYAVGSSDMASVCVDTADVCVAASDVATPDTCNSDVTTFTLPALGRVSSVGPHAGGPGVDAGPNPSWAPSDYPGGASNSITLDGTTSDSLRFGPTTPTPGVGSL